MLLIEAEGADYHYIFFLPLMQPQDATDKTAVILQEISLLRSQHQERTGSA